MYLSTFVRDDEVLLPPNLNFELISKNLKVFPNEYTIKVSLKNKYQFSRFKTYSVY
jgi:hypothetical protein